MSRMFDRVYKIYCDEGPQRTRWWKDLQNQEGDEGSQRTRWWKDLQYQEGKAQRDGGKTCSITRAKRKDRVGGQRNTYV